MSNEVVKEVGKELQQQKNLQERCNFLHARIGALETIKDKCEREIETARAEIKAKRELEKQLYLDLKQS